MGFLTAALVAGVAVGGWWWQSQSQAGQVKRQPPDPRPRLDDPKPDAPEPKQNQPQPEPPAPRGLLTDGDYYVHVKLIELRPKNGDDAWDVRGGTPDINFKVFWNDTLLYEGPTRDDRLIAEWDLISIDVHDAVLSGELDVAGAVNAPLVRASEGGVLRIEVWDDDDFTTSDQAGRFDLPMVTLRENLNKLTFAEGGVARIEVDLIPRETDLPDLLERASDR